MKAKDAIHECFEEEFSELVHSKQQIQDDWRSGNKILVGGLKCQNGTKIVLYSPFIFAIQVVYSILPKMIADFFLKEIASNELRAKPCLGTCSIVDTLQKAVEVVSKRALP